MTSSLTGPITRDDLFDMQTAEKQEADKKAKGVLVKAAEGAEKQGSKNAAGAAIWGKVIAREVDIDSLKGAELDLVKAYKKHKWTASGSALNVAYKKLDLRAVFGGEIMQAPAEGPV